MKVKLGTDGKQIVKVEQAEMNLLERTKSLARLMNNLDGGTNEPAINLATAIDVFKESLTPEETDGGSEELRGV